MRNGDQQFRDCAVAVFARYPRPGFVKTRLIPLLGAQGAAELQQALLDDAVFKLQALRGRAKLYLMKTGRAPYLADRAAQLDDLACIVSQRGRDLGERLQRTFGYLLRRHRSAVVIGTDSPELSGQAVHRALEELRWCEAALGPCPDGGYHLIGLRRDAWARNRGRALAGVRWGTAWALRDTLRNLVSAKVSCSLLPPVADVDRPADLIALHRRMSGNARARRMAPATWRFISAFDATAPNP
ncbi:MAG: TIGR04282 family arsenosugar biosynthesis glycosyltransferase [Terriglobia bacterium]